LLKVIKKNGKNETCRIYGEICNSYKVFVGKPHGNRLHWERRKDCGDVK
jgi:hypothetical protein